MSKWVARGKKFEGKASFYSKNPEKAEKTIKSWSPAKKKWFMDKHS